MTISGYEVNLKRSSRKKTLSIFIEREGHISVIAPDGLSETKIKEAILAKEYLIYSKLAKWKELNKGKVDRKWVNGQSYLYLGRNYRLNLVNDQEEDLLLKNGYFNLRKDKVEDAQRIFISFYKMKGMPKIKERLALIQNKFDKQPNEVKILELQNRWASCTPKGNINFHWKCLMTPVSVLDYIIAHEMVHLRHSNHSKEFWNDLDKVMPNYREYEIWLKENGVKMDL